MSHPIARRAGMLALTAAMLMPSAGALSDVSNWAQEGVAAAQNAGLAPSSLSNSAASGSITRAEFCAVALNAYKAVSCCPALTSLAALWPASCCPWRWCWSF